MEDKLDSILDYATYHDVDKDIWVSDKLNIKDKSGFRFIKKQFLKGIMLVGNESKHPLIRVDCSIDEHYNVIKHIQNIKSHGILSGVDYSGNVTYFDFEDKVNTVYSKDDIRLYCLNIEDEKAYIKKQLDKK